MSAEQVQVVEMEEEARERVVRTVGEIREETDQGKRIPL